MTTSRKLLIGVLLSFLILFSDSSPNQKVQNVTFMPLLTSNYTTNPIVQVAKELPFKSIDHIVIVVEENHSYKKIVGNSKAPYVQSLIKQGALFTKAYAVTHPSQPNYLALFSGSTQNVTDDSCKGPFSGANLASELKKAGLTFTGYSENLPKTGYTGCSTNVYARKHNPWAQFSNVPTAWNRPLTDFPKDFSKLPTVSFVIPNVKDDMHDGTIEDLYHLSPLGHSSEVKAITSVWK